MKFFIVLICSAAFFLTACGEDEGSGSSMFGLGAAAVESLPQLRQSGGKAYGSKATITSGTIADYNTLSTFFKLECIMPGMDDFCPSGVDATTGGDSNPYKLTSYTLIGSIYHADMYSGGLKTSCDDTSTTITSGSFVAASSGGDPAKFLLDYYSLLTCTGQDTSEDLGSGTKYQAYSFGGGTYQATLTTRYRNPYNGVSSPGQNDVFQVYVGVSSDEPVFLAYNYAGADSMYQRTVLLVNLETHRFAVKHYEPGSPVKNLVAIGVGGVNRTTGELNAGYYFAKFTDNSGTEDDGCIDNATGSFQSDDTPCTGASVPVTWSSSDTVATYLSMTDDDKTRLAAFLAKFTDQSFFASTDSPENSTTDPEQNFPQSITP
ncbi:MAG: hypothetical protein GY754_30570 [bacterium]|nr:hypothetical protein [bacterium]